MTRVLLLLFLSVQQGQDGMDRDVQLLLKNDDAVAQAKQQLAARQVTNVEYTRQIQELTKARNEILARYDRNGQRQLTALYTAAKKDQAIAAREAAARAAQEAQAKAKAEREAAQKAAAEKAEADRQAAQLQASRTEEDAAKVADLELRARALAAKQRLASLTEEEQRELARIQESLQALYRPYAAPDAAAGFRARVAQIHQARPAQETNLMLALLYPAPSRVLSDFPDDARRAAALAILKETLDLSSVVPRAPELVNLSTAYFAAINQSHVPTDLRKSLQEDAAFRAEVLNKYLPPAVQNIAERSPARQEAQAKALLTKIGRRYALTLWAMLLTPLVLLWLGARFRQRARTPEAADASDPRALPADLRTIRVPGQTYDVDLESGLVLDEKTWTETTSTVHTVPGQQQVIGNTIYTSGGYSYVTYGSTRKDRIFIRTPEGRDHPWICTDIGFETLKGHVVSRVAPAAGTPGENDFFLLYNHSTGQVVKLPGVNRRHVVRKRYLWLATAAVGVLGTVWAFQLDTPDSATGQPSAWGTLSGIMAFAALVLVALTAFVVRLLRNRTFNRRYYPQLCKLLVERSPTIIQRCGGGKNSSGL